MLLGNQLKKVFASLGENNNAVYAVLAIALAKGTLRPIFTMMDKHQDPESKKYAAVREGLTEAIACPTYLSFAILANKIAPKFLKNSLVQVGSKNSPDTLVLNDIYRTKFDKVIKSKGPDYDNQVRQLFSSLSPQEKSLFKNYKNALNTVKATTGFVGVCSAALIVIPALCNVVLNPVMKKIGLHSKNNQGLNMQSLADVPKKLDNQYCIKNSYKPTLLYAYQTNNSFGMKVGL